MNGCGVNASIVVKSFRGGIIENFVAEFVHNFPGKKPKKEKSKRSTLIKPESEWKIKSVRKDV